VTLTLLAGLIVSGAMYWQAESARASLALEKKATEHERDRALGAETLANTRLGEAVQARNDAERHAARATRVKAFLVEMLGALTPEKGNRPDLTVREMVDAGADRLKTSLLEEPEVRAEAMSTIGLVYAGLGLDDKARQFLAGAADLYRENAGADSLKYAGSLVELARLPWASPALAHEALARCDEAIAIYRKTLGEEDSKTIEALAVRMMILNTRGQGAQEWNAIVDAGLPMMLTMLKDSDFPEDIAQVMRRTRELAVAGDKPGIRKLWLEHRQEMTERVERSWSTGDREGAYAELRRHYAPMTKLRFFAGLIPRALTGMGVIVEYQDKALGAAEALFREAVNYGRDNPGQRGETYRHSLLALAEFLRDHGSAGESESLYTDALRIFRDTSGNDSPDAAIILMNLAMLRHAAGDDRAAEPHARECLRIRRATLAPGHYFTVETLELLGEILQGTGDAAGAESAFWESLDCCAREFDASDWRTANAESLLGGCLLAAGKAEDARPLLTRSYQNLRESNAEPSYVEEARKRLARLEAAQATAPR
jgi:tetratricopeptide (TPR) repeat protein